MTAVPPFPACIGGADVLAPLMYELSKSQTAEFHFLNGPHEVPRFPGLDYQHQGPFYRYLDDGAPDIARLATVMQDIPSSARTPEDTCRVLGSLCDEKFNPQNAISHVLDFADNSDMGPFDGLLGFSEGAMVAAYILMEQERTLTQHPFKCAIFFSGVPPARGGNAGPYLADECGQLIKSPTVHFFGARDPGKHASVALANLCTSDNAVIYDHGHGHEIPRAPARTKRMAQIIREMVAAV